MDNIKFVEKGWLSHWVLWEEDDLFRIITLKNPNRPADHGGHIVVEQKDGKISSPYQDYQIFAKVSILAAVVQKAVELTGIAPHSNIQMNGNWAWKNSDGSLLSVEDGLKKRRVHSHIYPRLPADPCWGDPAYLATYREQVIDRKYENRAFTMPQMVKLKEFLEKEIPIALKSFH